MSRTLAPSGTPIQFRDLAKCIAQLSRDPAGHLLEQMRTDLGVNHAFLFSTGRGAMSFLLQCMIKERADSARRYVVVPSFTCYSVVASVLKSGLEVLVCDIDPLSLSLSVDQLRSIDFSKVIAVVSTGLFGVPGDMVRIEKIVAESGAYLIDDAAQTLGATFAERPAGTFGDAGILSFDKGKVVTSINGGVIVSNNDALALRIAKEHEHVASPSYAERAMDLLKLKAYFLMLRPSLYWIPQSLPFLRLGETRYDESYPIKQYFHAMAPLVSEQLRRMSLMNEHRHLCAASYASQIPKNDHLTEIVPTRGSEPIYLRFPLRIRDVDIRSRFLEAYRRRGCVASYPRSIIDVPEIQHRIHVHSDTCEGGRTIASELVTLPTHAYVREGDIKHICRGLSDPRASVAQDASSMGRSRHPDA